MDVKSIFVNKHAELRSGWRIIIFALLLLTLAFPLLSAVSGFKSAREYLGPLFLLLAIMASTFLVVKYINKKSVTAIGLSLHPATFLEFGAGCLLGFLMMAGIFIVEVMLGYVQVQWIEQSLGGVLWTIVVAVLFFAVGAFLEEVLFRGYLFQTLIQGVTFLPAMLIMGLLFSLAHAGNPNVSIFGLINVGLAAIWLSFAYMKTRSLWLPFGLHFSWNFAQTTVFGFPTSGGEFADKRLVSLVQGGPEWMTGGAFGPEGGILATIALVACTWYILKAKWITTPEGIVTLDSVEDLLPPREIPEEAGE